MKPEEIQAALQEKFGDSIIPGKHDGNNPWVGVKPDKFLEVARFLKDDPRLAFDYLRDLAGVDWLLDEKKATKLGIQPHLEVLYQLFSFKHRHDITIKVSVDRWQGGKTGELPTIPSVASVWKIADWHECEAYDLIGIQFTGHPNLRRMLCPEDWEGHPLRKDYPMPKEYHGIRWQ